MRSIALWLLAALVCSYSAEPWANPNDCYGDKSKYEACLKKSAAARGDECAGFKKAYKGCLAKVDKENHRNATMVNLPPGSKVERNLTGSGQDRHREETLKGGNMPRHFTGAIHRKAEVAQKATGLVDRPDCRYTITAGSQGLDARVADVAGGPKHSKEYLIRQSDIKKSKRSDCVPYKR